MLHISSRSRENTICLDTYVIRDKNCIGYCCSNPKNLEEKLKIASYCNFKNVELWHKDVSAYIKNFGLNSLLDILEKYNLKVSSYKVLEGWFEGESNFNVIECAANIKSSCLVVKLVSDSNLNPSTDINFYVERYKQLIKICEKNKLYPCLEFMCLAKKMNNIDVVYDILNKTNHEYCSLVLDTWHLWRNDCENFNNFENTLSNLNKNWVKLVHFTDARKDIPRENQKDGDRKIPKEGCLNLNKFCNMLNSIDVKTIYSLNVYDQSLWNENPYEVAKKSMDCFNNYFDVTYKNLGDSEKWKDNQKFRCEGLWKNSYKTHLDPRFSKTNRTTQLEEILDGYLKNKIVLDFKCGFSPLEKYMTYGFDAYEECINFLNQNCKNAKWFCMSDDEFTKTFDEKIDVLLHIGLGDSNTEISNHLLLRKKCNPSLVVIECAANSDGTVSESKIGNTKNWDLLKKDLIEKKEFFIKTDMNDRSFRLLIVGKYKND